MLVLSKIPKLPKFKQKIPDLRLPESNLQNRFVLRVLAPPFAVLLVLSLIGFWQFGRLVRNQAVNEIRRSADATAIRLDREFAVRETVLKRTGEELFSVRSKYTADRTKLDSDRDACRNYVANTFSFDGAPNNVCESFLAGFAKSGTNIQAIDSEYTKQADILANNQSLAINQRLSAFKQFFPETLSLIVVDNKKQPISFASSGGLNVSIDDFKTEIEAATATPLRGKLVSKQNENMIVFAYPIDGGTVLAAYGLNTENFVQQAWASAPIDRSNEAVVITDSSGQPVYPQLRDEESFVKANTALRNEKFLYLETNNIKHIAVASKVGTSDWLVVIASPSAKVLAPLRDAQISAVLIIGSLLVGFLWVGTFFIQRSVRNINSLVSGAQAFGTGHLGHKISLAHADKEFVTLAENMNNMASRIASAEKALDEKNKEFISIASHELRAPITAIIATLSVIKEDKAKEMPSKVKPVVKQAYDSALRLRDIVNDLLDIANLEAESAKLEIAPQDIETMIVDVLRDNKMMLDAAHVGLAYDPANARTVQADASRLRIVLNNFVSNAIKYNRAGGTVKISHSIKDNQLVTLISDDGLGIPDEQKQKMFEKFFRVSGADRASITGTGLGMYITRKSVLAMNGDVWFDSTHGKGSTFYFSLPIAPSAVKHASRKRIISKFNPFSRNKTRT